MSAEHRLNPVQTGIYGKHPAFGDFIAAGLPEQMPQRLGDWLAAVLGQWREAVGDSWQVQFDAMAPLSFWIGPALLDGQALRGVAVPSRDRTGRRFPLVVAQTDGPAPVVDADQSFHQAALASLCQLLQLPEFQPREAAQQFQAHLAPATHAAENALWPSFWAVNRHLDPAQLFSGLAAADYHNAISARSYWWFGADGIRPSGVLACQGLPGLSEMGWLVSGWREMAATEAEEAT